MTPSQKVRFVELLSELNATEFHHGDCIGADAEAHRGALALKIPVYVHPPTVANKRAFCEGADFFHPAEDYLYRNRRIVDSTEILIAAPRTSREMLRSGTWATIRYARKRGRPIYLITPD